MNCPKCNAVISDSSKFCAHCGTKIEKPVENVPEAKSAAVCIKCGAPLKPGAKFCVKCGAAQNVQPVQPAQPVSQPVQPAKPVSQPVQPAPQPVSQPVQPAPQPVDKQPKSNMAAQKQAPIKKSKMPLVLITAFALIIAFMAGGYFILVKAFDVNSTAMVTGSEDGSKDKDEFEDEDGEDASLAREDDQEQNNEEEKGDPELLNALDTQAEAARQALEAMLYQEAAEQSNDLIYQYVEIGEENNLKEEAGEKIEYVFDIASKATIESCKGIESQGCGSAGYEQITSMVNAVLKVESFLRQNGYKVDSSEIREYGSGTVQRFKDTFIRQINEITEREQWSRDEAWTYAEQAYSIQKKGKTLLFDENDLDDPLRLRYVYCLAWITRKRCENGVADGSMTNEDAFNTAVAILQETDYNLLVLQDIISYGSAAGKDISPYQAAYDAIIQKLKDEQNLSIVNSGVNSATSVDIRKFWYFNDLSGDDAYKVDINNGTTQATRDWIRDNIPSYINN